MLKHKLKHPNIKVTRDYDESLPKLTMHGSELNQVWTNLVDNAVAAMAGRGTLTVRTSRVGEDLVVEVGDTGTGIPPEVKRRIFEPFFTTKAVGKGTGLGLSQVYGFAHQSGGAVTVASALAPRFQTERRASSSADRARASAATSSCTAR